MRQNSPGTVANDRSLNRRNLDAAMQEWARLHKDELGMCFYSFSLVVTSVAFTNVQFLTMVNFLFKFSDILTFKLLNE